MFLRGPGTFPRFCQGVRQPWLVARTGWSRCGRRGVLPMRDCTASQLSPGLLELGRVAHELQTLCRGRLPTSSYPCAGISRSLVESRGAVGLHEARRGSRTLLSHGHHWEPSPECALSACRKGKERRRSSGHQRDCPCWPWAEPWRTLPIRRPSSPTWI
jgi:hypothetical protein